MDKTSKKFKLWRSIGLVALTIIVIGVIILTIVLTQKKDNNSAETTHNIGETFIINEKCEFKVVDIQFIIDSAEAGIALEKGQCLAKIWIEVKAIKNVTIKKGDFKLNKEAVSTNDFNSKVVIKPNEEKFLQVGFVVAYNSVLPLNLKMFGCKVPMGSSLVTEGIK